MGLTDRVCRIMLKFTYYAILLFLTFIPIPEKVPIISNKLPIIIVDIQWIVLQWNCIKEPSPMKTTFSTHLTVNTCSAVAGDGCISNIILPA